MADGTTTPVLCRVPQWLKAWLEDGAKKEDRSLNKQIVHVLKDAAQRCATIPQGGKDHDRGY